MGLAMPACWADVSTGLNSLELTYSIGHLSFKYTLWELLARRKKKKKDVFFVENYLTIRTAQAVCLPTALSLHFNMFIYSNTIFKSTHNKHKHNALQANA